MYNEQKTAQIAGWFLAQANGRMPHLKLMKLMYLAEREALGKHSFSMTGDHFVSMPHGPVLSLTLGHINDDSLSNETDGWDTWIGDLANYEVTLVRAVVDRDSFDELSDIDIEVLQRTWDGFGHMGKYQIRDYTHDKRNCPEWTDPKGSSKPIMYADVFKAFGYNEEQAALLESNLQDHNRVARALTA
jgi:uncharacterized phage-associated protein